MNAVEKINLNGSKGGNKKRICALFVLWLAAALWNACGGMDLGAVEGFDQDTIDNSGQPELAAMEQALTQPLESWWVKNGKFVQIGMYCYQEWKCVHETIMTSNDCTKTCSKRYDTTWGVCTAGGGPIDSCNHCTASVNQPDTQCLWTLTCPDGGGGGGGGGGGSHQKRCAMAWEEELICPAECSASDCFGSP